MSIFEFEFFENGSQGFVLVTAYTEQQALKKARKLRQGLVETPTVYSVEDFIRIYEFQDEY